MANGQKITGADASFYMHEIAEATMMQQGMAYDIAHLLALEKYEVSPFSVYSPDVIRQFPEMFSKGFMKFWNLEWEMR